MERESLLEQWNDMWNEGNWVPSWPDSLAGLSPEDALWSPDSKCHSIWQEVVHVTFWRRVTLARMAGAPPPNDADIQRQEFALPETTNADAWSAAMETLKEAQDAIAAAIQNESVDISRIPYHLIHDAYHLGRITQLRGMLGTPPKF